MRLKVSEHFLSIQGEGESAGIISVFLRLTGCLLSCHFCDTESVWRKGEHYTLAELTTLFKQQGYTKALLNGAHLVVTGGDPMIQAKPLTELIRNHFMPRPVVEIETEGLITPSDNLDDIVAYWNVSPKLSNSGMPLVRRYNEKTIRWHAERATSIFKFVVANQADVDEVEKFIAANQIDPAAVFLMPACASRKEFMEKATFVADSALKIGVNFSPRLHLILWDRATGC